LRNGVKSCILHISIGGHFGKTMRPVPPYNLTSKSPSSAKAVHDPQDMIIIFIDKIAMEHGRTNQEKIL
jgi:hypothetical protein